MKRLWFLFCGVGTLVVAVVAFANQDGVRGPGVSDKGIFSELDDRVTGILEPSGKALSKRNDMDGDGIPNQSDVLRGALKTAINGATYDSSYHRIDYPFGDVPRDRGCCVDVAIRALRNAGLDLQKEMHEDILRRPGAYAAIEKPNPNIDHRRVRNIRVYMEKYFTRMPHESGSAAPRASWQPGDIVLFDTLNAPGPDHIGVVSHNTGPSGYLTVVNNWAPGSVTKEMDLLDWCPVTHHFRMR